MFFDTSASGITAGTVAPAMSAAGTVAGGAADPMGPVRGPGVGMGGGAGSGVRGVFVRMAGGAGSAAGARGAGVRMAGGAGSAGGVRGTGVGVGDSPRGGSTGVRSESARGFRILRVMASRDETAPSCLAARPGCAAGTPGLGVCAFRPTASFDPLTPFMAATQRAGSQASEETTAIASMPAKVDIGAAARKS
jgi:hypothetical protein